MVSYSLHVACGAFVGESVGAAKPGVALQYYKVSITIGLMASFTQIFGFWLGRDLVIELLQDDEQVSQIIRDAWYAFSLTNFIGSLSFIGTSVLNRTLN